MPIQPNLILSIFSKKYNFSTNNSSFFQEICMLPIFEKLLYGLKHPLPCKIPEFCHKMQFNHSTVPLHEVCAYTNHLTTLFFA